MQTRPRLIINGGPKQEVVAGHGWWWGGLQLTASREEQLSRQASHVHRMGLGDGDSNSSRQTGPQTSVERVRRNQEARRKARRNAQWKDDSRNQGGANGNTSNADGRWTRETHRNRGSGGSTRGTGRVGEAV
ncbi:hypothetical protein E4U40_003185 [Claviceps sp. LM458 group G5]|nr:hypothetical protein E4U40_003185 [Claviceps sp. LM458 group G5]